MNYKWIAEHNTQNYLTNDCFLSLKLNVSSKVKQLKHFHYSFKNILMNYKLVAKHNTYKLLYNILFCFLSLNRT